MSSPTSLPKQEHVERGRDTPQVCDGEGETSSTSLASAGGEGGGEGGGGLPSPSRAP